MGGGVHQACGEIIGGDQDENGVAILDLGLDLMMGVEEAGGGEDSTK